MAGKERKPIAPLTFERVWRGSGIAFVVTFLVAYIVHGRGPGVGASAATLDAFYDGDRTRVLIGSALLGLALLNLLWFGAALSSTLRDAGQGIWAAAATASSAALGTILFAVISVGAALAYSVAGTGAPGLTSGLNDLAVSCVVLASFPAAMLVMSGTFGLRQTGTISKSSFYAGVAAVVLLVLGGTTWARGGVWAPDGAYARIIVPILAFGWVAIVSGLLYTQSPSTTQAPRTAAMPA
jgi:hypothetical protein